MRTSARLQRDHQFVRIALVCSVLSWIGPFSMDAYSPAFPALADDFDVVEQSIQLTLTATLLGMCIGQFAFAPLSDRLGRRGPLLVALVVYIVASAACAAAPNVEWLIAARFVQGFAAAGAMSIARAIGRDVYTGQQLVRFYSLVGATTAIAPVVGPMTGAFLVEHSGWRWIFVLITLFGVVGVALVIWALPETGAPVARSALDTVLLASGRLTQADLARLGLVCVILGGTNGAVFAYLAGSSFLLQDGYGFSATQYGYVFAANAAGIFFVSAANSVLARRFSPALLLTVSVPLTLAVGIGLLMSAAFDAGLLVVVPLFAILIACLGLVVPNATGLAMDVSRSKAGLVSSVVGLAQFLAGALIAPLVGGAEPGGGVPTMFVVILVCTTLSTLALVAGWRSGVWRTKPTKDDEHDPPISVPATSAVGDAAAC